MGILITSRCQAPLCPVRSSWNWYGCYEMNQTCTLIIKTCIVNHSHPSVCWLLSGGRMKWSCVILIHNHPNYWPAFAIQYQLLPVLPSSPAWFQRKIKGLHQYILSNLPLLCYKNRNAESLTWTNETQLGHFLNQISWIPNSLGNFAHLI